jgi:hypothetical protein
MLLLLLALFMAPLAFAFWLYYGSSWRPASTTNYGELIAPARALPTIALPRADGTVAAAEALRGKWSLVVVADGACDAACRATLDYARQTILGMGRLQARVQQVLLVTGNCCDRQFLSQQPDLLTLDASGSNAASLLTQFPTTARERQIFVVDPLGNLMMSYNAQLEPKGLRADLKQLLDLSQIG